MVTSAAQDQPQIIALTGNALGVIEIVTGGCINDRVRQAGEN
jgi:hypothetical protein